MAQTQTVTLPDGGRTWTAVDDRFGIVEPVEAWLEWLRVACRCRRRWPPHTAKISHSAARKRHRPINPPIDLSGAGEDVEPGFGASGDVVE